MLYLIILPLFSGLYCNDDGWECEDTDTLMIENLADDSMRQSGALGDYYDCLWYALIRAISSFVLHISGCLNK